MSHRERRVLPPPLPRQLCGEEELKKEKKNWFDRQLLNLDALFWNAGYVRADGVVGFFLFFFVVEGFTMLARYGDVRMKNSSNWREERRRFGGGESVYCSVVPSYIYKKKKNSGRLVTCASP